RRAVMVTNPPEKTIVQGLRSTCCAWPNSLCWPLARAPANSRRDKRIMGHRLSKIVTRTGDAGTTGLGDGSRVGKDSARIDAIGAVHELNSSLGLLLAEELPDAVAACLIEIQHDLFDLGGELSIPGHATISEAQVLRLEEAVERFNANLRPLKEFILPGGTRAASLAHI